MSSPLHSLKKGPKSRMFVGTGLSLDSIGQRPVPFRQPHYTEDESKLLDEITTNMASTRIKTQNIYTTTGNTGPSPVPSGSGLPKLSKTNYSTSKSNTAPSDHDLMSLMMNKVTLLEQRVQYQNIELTDKDKRIKILEEKIKIMKKASESNEPSHSQELEKKCLLLKQQIHEMETFLSDYGMIWMGEKSSGESECYLEDEEREDEETGNEDQTDDDLVWRPGSSVSAAQPFYVDYDLLVENIRDLNVLAGEGVAKVTKTTDGARLKIPEAIPLILYKNGIILYQGPFRPFSDPTTQGCVQDLLDGYFPTELQQRYPDGIPFAVTDKRTVKFTDKRHKKIFEGAGQVLGGDTKPSRLIPSNLNKTHHRVMVANQSTETSADEETSELPGNKMRVEDLLNRLPKSVIRDGKVIDIRNSIGQQIKGDGGENGDVGISVVETSASNELKKRLEEKSKNKDRPVTPRNITTLRIKSECGNQTYVIKMRFTETIGDLRQYLLKHRRSGSSKFTIMSTYPSQSFTDNTATLEQCGLIPNAVLHLRTVKS